MNYCALWNLSFLEALMGRGSAERSQFAARFIFFPERYLSLKKINPAWIRTRFEVDRVTIAKGSSRINCPSSASGVLCRPDIFPSLGAFASSLLEAQHRFYRESDFESAMILADGVGLLLKESGFQLAEIPVYDGSKLIDSTSAARLDAILSERAKSKEPIWRLYWTARLAGDDELRSLRSHNLLGNSPLIDSDGDGIPDGYYRHVNNCSFATERLYADGANRRVLRSTMVDGRGLQYSIDFRLGRVPPNTTFVFEEEALNQSAQGLEVGVLFAQTSPQASGRSGVDSTKTETFSLGPGSDWMIKRVTLTTNSEKNIILSGYLFVWSGPHCEGIVEVSHPTVYMKASQAPPH